MLHCLALAGTCGGNSGYLPEVFIIIDPPLYGGSCPSTNGSTRANVLTCVNNDPCPPVDCVGSFVNSGSCNGTCGGGAGWQTKIYTISTAAAWGGANCAEAAGTRQYLPCNNTACCPVNCFGGFVQNGNCTGACSGGSGKLPEKYVVTTPKSCGGTNCPYANGFTRLTTNCNNTTPCPPRDCVGSWVAGQCNGTCGGGAGLRPETYIVTVTAAYNGTDCPEVNGATRMITPCNNSNPCPINCMGNWTVLDSSNCTGVCDGGAGFVPERYVVSQPDMHGGVVCPSADGALR